MRLLLRRGVGPAQPMNGVEPFYIPAENIESPFECLARLDKHRNVDVCPFRLLPFTLK